MVLKIHHVPSARSTQPLWVYFELKESYGDQVAPLEIEYIDMEKFRYEKTEEYLKKNPNGKVPLLEDTDENLSMWESCAISYYLLDRFDVEDKLGPRKSDPKYLALFHQFAFYSSGTLDNLSAISSPIQMVIEDKKPGNRQETLDQNCRAFKEISGPLLSKQLGNSNYMAGDNFTAIDIMIGYSLLSIRRKVPWFLDGFPTLTAYIKRLEQRPAYQNATKSP